MNWIPAPTLKQMLHDGDEMCLLDVREAGQHGAGHPFLAVPCPYSRLELLVERLLPRKTVRIVLLDGGDGLSARAHRRLDDLGYSHVMTLEGGVAAWKAAGFELFSGTHVPSKAFGEFVESTCHTPLISAGELKGMMDRGENVIVVDGRPKEEYVQYSIPGGICCPNGELPLRIREIAPDPDTTIVVNCAGRTRSIIGAQSLIHAAVPNPVRALENGTMGWSLAGFDREHGAKRHFPKAIPERGLADDRILADRLATNHGIERVTRDTLEHWRNDPDGTLYHLDVRTKEEFEDAHVVGAIHAPGGQLIQATETWIGVRGARVVLTDDGGSRAVMTASWLRQMGYDAYVLRNAVDSCPVKTSSGQHQQHETLPTVSPEDALKLVTQGRAEMLDVRSSMKHRQAHPCGAKWATRSRLEADSRNSAEISILLADDSGVAALAADDLREAGIDKIYLLSGGLEAWRDAGLPIEESASSPSDEECIDYLFFVHDRHRGNLDAARTYLSWETGLPKRLDARERALFRPIAGPYSG